MKPIVKLTSSSVKVSVKVDIAPETSREYNLTVSRGNMKLGNVPNLSLPPIITCPENTPCAKTCYAIKAWRMFPSAKRAWMGNLSFWENRPMEFEHALRLAIEVLGAKFFRYHVAGDIPCQAYADMIGRIARANPKTRFLVFTKRYGFNYRAPDNLTIVFSAWPGLAMPRTTRPIAFMRDAAAPDKRIRNALDCPGTCETCGACWWLKKLKKNVVFDKH